MKRAIAERLPLSGNHLPQNTGVCPVCRTGKVETESEIVSRFDAKCTNLEDIQERLFTVVLIAMQYVHHIRHTDGLVDSEFFDLEDYLWEVFVVQKGWILVGMVFIICILAMIVISILEPYNGISILVIPSFATYLLIVTLVIAWVYRIRSNAMAPIEETFEKIENGRIPSHSMSSGCLLETQCVSPQLATLPSVRSIFHWTLEPPPFRRHQSSSITDHDTSNRISSPGYAEVLDLE